MILVTDKNVRIGSIVRISPYFLNPSFNTNWTGECLSGKRGIVKKLPKNENSYVNTLCMVAWEDVEGLITYGA